jgi:hypothetical protein
VLQVKWRTRLLSHTQSPSIMSGGFGPVTKDGFGVGYSLFEDELGLHITDFSGNAKVRKRTRVLSFRDMGAPQQANSRPYHASQFTRAVWEV